MFKSIRCRACDEFVEYNLRRYSDRNIWHDECFICVVCSKQLTQKSFHSLKGEVFCKKCHETTLGYDIKFGNYRFDSKGKNFYAKSDSNLNYFDSILLARMDNLNKLITSREPIPKMDLLRRFPEIRGKQIDKETGKTTLASTSKNDKRQPGIASKKLLIDSSNSTLSSYLSRTIPSSKTIPVSSEETFSKDIQDLIKAARQQRNLQPYIDKNAESLNDTEKGTSQRKPQVFVVKREKVKKCPNSKCSKGTRASDSSRIIEDDEFHRLTSISDVSPGLDKYMNSQEAERNLQRIRNEMKKQEYESNFEDDSCGSLTDDDYVVKPSKAADKKDDTAKKPTNRGFPRSKDQKVTGGRRIADKIRTRRAERKASIAAASEGTSKAGTSKIIEKPKKKEVVSKMRVHNTDSEEYFEVMRKAVNKKQKEAEKERKNVPTATQFVNKLKGDIFSKTKIQQTVNSDSEEFIKIPSENGAKKKTVPPNKGKQKAPINNQNSDKKKTQNSNPKINPDQKKSKIIRQQVTVSSESWVHAFTIRKSKYPSGASWATFTPGQRSTASQSQTNRPKFKQPNTQNFSKSNSKTIPTRNNTDKKFNSLSQRLSSLGDQIEIQTRNFINSNIAKPRLPMFLTYRETQKIHRQIQKNNEVQFIYKADSVYSTNFRKKMKTFFKDICRRCDKEVYAVEKVYIDGKTYHLDCYNCLNCGRRLDSLNAMPRKTEIYCKQCYMKYFGPHIYGYNMPPNCN